MNTELHPNKASEFLLNFQQTRITSKKVYNCESACIEERPYEPYQQSYEASSLLFYETHQAYLTGSGTLLHGNQLFISYSICSDSLLHKPPQPLKYSDTSLDIVIGGMNPLLSLFGHFVCDWFVFVQILPQRILDTASFVFSKGTSFASQMVGLLGVPENHIFFEDPSEVIKARKVIALVPTRCLSGNTFLYRRLKNISINKLGVINAKPFRMVLFDRSPKKKRNIKGLLDILELLQERAGNIAITLCSDFGSPLDGLRFFAEIKLIFTVHGSILGNIFTMNEEGIVCDYQTQKRFFTFEYMARSIGVRYVFTGSRNTSQFTQEVELDKEKVERLFSYAFDNFLMK